MRNVLDPLLRAQQAGTPVVLATLVGATGSSPLPRGTSMVIAADGAVHGGVSSGCIEGAVHDRASEVLRTGEAVCVSFGASEAGESLGLGATGLACGGVVEIFLQRVDPESPEGLGEILDAVAAGRAASWSQVIAHPDPRQIGAPIEPDHRDGVDSAGGAGDPGGVAEPMPGVRTFTWVFRPLPRLLVAGASDIGAAVAALGDLQGYRVTVCDARPLFATADRLPRSATVEVVREWPHRYLEREVAAGRIDGRTAIVVLTHDEKFDLPLLTAALRLPVAYVGAMGSRRTHDARVAALRDAGLGEELDRLRSPIGLDLGGREPAQIALSVLAEIVALRYGGSGAPLRDGPGTRKR